VAQTDENSGGAGGSRNDLRQQRPSLSTEPTDGVVAGKLQLHSDHLASALLRPPCVFGHRLCSSPPLLAIIISPRIPQHRTESDTQTITTHPTLSSPQIIMAPQLVRRQCSQQDYDDGNCLGGYGNYDGDDGSSNWWWSSVRGNNNTVHSSRCGVEC